ncbi:MAG: molybdenum cofactor biosynthesis protein MoaE [Gammaproteobacteria bacterium]|nr:molybdenum cofactor biosynthesis protein MoaE [Gammaproteobacteria bacterium]
MPVVLQEFEFLPYQRLQEYEEQCRKPGESGAAVTFVGSLRDMHEDFPVDAMTIECYPEMALQEIEKVCDAATKQWQVDDYLIMHRYGKVEPGDALVLVAVWSTHRSQAFDACRYIIHYLKHKAPFWKQEHHGEQSRWLQGNTDDKAVSECHG